MAKVAFTRIEHGDKDGKLIVVEEGAEVKGLPKELVDQLAEQGIIGEPAKTESDRDEDIAELEDENDALKAQVAELKKQLAEKSTPPAK
jgi:protein-L-isoaspartate O-methyltransferase